MGGGWQEKRDENGDKKESEVPRKKKQQIVDSRDEQVGSTSGSQKNMDKQLQIKLNVNLLVTETLRGFDQFMNLVSDNTVEVNGNEKNEIIMAVIQYLIR
ncbi:putative small nuclear ribonucleoprotein G [Capsicum baccatum]|uniref:Small nuclear ribonucleoprotein G n=1 Tax=Capsicum baccatum TaxID=33114 RepID=A0A2G2X019_CAPBA|nr:putative small nuclear ribonucleoprotein G [Capsicum baccatum]